VLQLSLRLSRVFSIELEVGLSSCFFEAAGHSIFIDLHRPRLVFFNNPGELYWLGQSLSYSWAGGRGTCLA
jgi:hypothetical protein